MIKSVPEINSIGSGHSVDWPNILAIAENKNWEEFELEEEGSGNDNNNNKLDNNGSNSNKSDGNSNGSKPEEGNNSGNWSDLV
jgi:hypothetical protein